jgi:hypothetical protein
MKSALMILLLVVTGCHHNPLSAHRPSRGNESTSTSHDGESALKTFIGKVPKNEFAMPAIANGVESGSIQGCFVDAKTEECIVVLYPKGMKRPDRNLSIQVSGRVRIVKSSPPSSKESKIFMQYNQKVVSIDSWKYMK